MLDSLQIDLPRLLAELDLLASLTDCPQTHDPALPAPQRAVTRILFTARDLEARAWLKKLAKDAGLHLREDAVGNIFLRWQGRDPTLPAVATGSHIDAIPHAGMFDGTVGVLAALEAFRALRRTGFHPLRSLELVMLTSEEPTRFGIGCLGSRLLGGALDPALADQLTDRLHESDPTASAGGTLRTVRQSAGYQGDLSAVRLAPGHYHAWAELHIEQGPLLEQAAQADLPSHPEQVRRIGLVTAIAAPASYRFTLEGHGGHAGALLMPFRRDALCAAAELILAIEHHALAANQQSGSPDTVATVGTANIYPGNINAVPSRVALTLDLRDTDRPRRDRVLAAIRTSIQDIARRREVRISEETINADPPTTSSPLILDAIRHAAAAEQTEALPMVSRAYHDTSFLALVAPVAMLFIPCRNGVSHRPDEYTTPEALELGTRVLARTLASLAS